MRDKKCVNCRFQGVCRDTKISWLFFLTGLVATVAMRVIEPLRSINPLYAKLSWYIGVAGFFLFFAYKYKTNKDRSKLIQETNLQQKLISNQNLTPEEDNLILQIICSQDNPKERINYLIIFALSAAAFVVALILDLS